MNLQNKSSLFIRFFISYMTMLFLVLLFSGYIYFNYVLSTAEYVDGSISAYFERQSAEFDMQFDSISRIPVEIYMDKNVSFNAINETLTPEKSYNWVAIIEKLKGYRVANKIIDSVFIYFQNYDYIITDNGLYSFDEWYITHISKDVSTAQIFKKKNLSGELQDRSVILPEDILQKNRIICFSTKYPNDYFDTFIVTGLVIKEDYLHDSIINNQFFKDLTIIISDKEASNLSFSSSNYKLNTGILPAHIPEGLSYKDELVTFKKISGNSKWSYTYIMPANPYRDKLFYVKAIVLLCIILTLIMGVIIAYSFSKLNYNPIKRIADLFSEKSNKKVIGDYKNIEQNILDTLEEKQKMADVLLNQKVFLKNEMLNRLVTGRLHTDFLNKDFFIRYGINLKFDSFIIILLNRHMQPDMQDELIASVMGNKMSDDEKFEFNVLDYDNYHVYIIGFHDGMSGTFQPDLLEKALEAFRFKASGTYGDNVYISYSDICCNISQLKRTFMNTLNAIDYVIFMNKGKIVSSKIVSDFRNSDTAEANTKIRKYMNFLQAGQYDSSQTELSDIFCIFRNCNYSLELIRLNILNIYNMTMNSVSDTSISENVNIFNETTLSKSLLNPESLTELEEAYSKFFSELIESERDNLSASQQIVADFKELVEDKYGDCNLCIQYITDKLDISASYLSRLIKKQTGKGVLEYIQNFRIQKAIELMKVQPSFSITKIALLVGFIDDIAFIRVFKKYQGVTPGRYKQSSIINDNQGSVISDSK